MNIVLILVGYVAGLCLTYILDVVLCWLEFSEYDFLTYVFGGEYEELGIERYPTLKTWDIPNCLQPKRLMPVRFPVS